MENLKIKVNTPEESKEAQELFFELGATLGNGDHHAVIVPGAIGLAVIDGLINFVFSQIVHSDIAQAREITLPQLRDMVVLHRNDVNDATHEDNGNKYYVTSDDKLYGFILDGWALSTANRSPTFKPINKQPDAVASPNDIARTAEDHREHNLVNELNDLCAEFGCLPGQNRMAWLRDRLRGTCKSETLYHYSASINTARGTVAYDGVITFPGRITGIEDYQQVRAEIAKDGNVAPEQVNVHSLSVIN